MKTELLLPSEVAEILRLSSRQVSKLAQRGEIPCVTLPDGDIRFDESDVCRWINERRQIAAIQK